MNRRTFLHFMSASIASLIGTVPFSHAKTYVTPDQAKILIWGDLVMEPLTIELSSQQQQSIQMASDVWVRSKKIKALKSKENHWLIYDTVIGKHENIELAVGLTNEGEVKGIEIMVYRESYGYEIMNPHWLAQFLNKKSSHNVKIDHNIKNISGATLSCVHVTDGINRLTHTWHKALRFI